MKPDFEWLKLLPAVELYIRDIGQSLMKRVKSVGLTNEERRQNLLLMPGTHLS